MKALPLAAGAALSLMLSNAPGQQYYQTKAPYPTPPDGAGYEAPPPGYRAVSTQLLARHGSRGLSGFKTDLAMYRLWQQAEKEGALTPLGAQLGPDILALMKANFLLGYGVDGIGKPGYGNETLQGVAEHTQLARRMHRRLPELFRDAAAKRRAIVVVTSGKDRAVDSGYFFTRSLVAQQTGLEPLLALTSPAPLAPRGESDHASRPAGTDRYLLYFHKLSAKQDRPTAPADPLNATYQASQAYQRWQQSDELRERMAAIMAQPRLAEAARATLERLFQPAFVAALDQGLHQAANTGGFSFTSADGRFTNTLAGDGDTKIASATDAALALYELYAAAADMRDEVPADFTRYVPSAQAGVFASIEDALAFYEKGPGVTENGDLTWRMARTLLDDFFDEVDAVARGDMRHAAKLRFSHAEIVIPMAALLGLPGMSGQLPRATMYNYENSGWRGETVAPMAANIQWDVYRNARGRTLVRLLYNEIESDFKPACDAARFAAGSRYYDYHKLKKCYKDK